MSENIKQIAKRLKALREIYGYSIEYIASELGIYTEIYTQYENGELDIPVSFLFKAANRYGVELSALLTGEDPKLKVYSLVRKDKRLSIDRRKEYKYQSLAYNFINKKAEPFMVTVDYEEDKKEVSLNSHPGQEFNFLLEGTLKIVIGSYELILHEGDSIYFDSGYPHGMIALDNKPAKFLAIIL
ncbi:helix-turn-helix domain-containing protein [Xylanivirga thermophila]|uniref:helix-turn-helix domain-containing protein n=1 Tax=Xylanivirga thermophila TaxID=2496273 RepID=UPI00101D53F4|nr:cupin domain-containing protein [Xylanivirga thermophila]